MRPVALFVQTAHLSARRKRQLFARRLCSQHSGTANCTGIGLRMVPRAVDPTGRAGTAVNYTVHGSDNLTLAKSADLVGFIGTKNALSSDVVSNFIGALADFVPKSDMYTVWNTALSEAIPGDFGSSTTIPYVVDGKMRKMFLGVVPDPAKVSLDLFAGCSLWHSFRWKRRRAN